MRIKNLINISESSTPRFFVDAPPFVVSPRNTVQQQLANALRTQVMASPLPAMEVKFFSAAPSGPSDFHDYFLSMYRACWDAAQGGDETHVYQSPPGSPSKWWVEPTIGLIPRVGGHWVEVQPPGKPAWLQVSEGNYRRPTNSIVRGQLHSTKLAQAEALQRWLRTLDGRGTVWSVRYACSVLAVALARIGRLRPWAKETAGKVLALARSAAHPLAPADLARAIALKTATHSESTDLGSSSLIGHAAYHLVCELLVEPLQEDLPHWARAVLHAMAAGGLSVQEITSLASPPG